MKIALLDMVLEHWPSILLVLLFVTLIGIMWTRGYKKEVKKIIYDLVVTAEEQLGSGTGDAKRARVKRWIYERAPWIVKIFITYDTFDDLIEDAVNKLKAFLSEGGDLLTYSENYSVNDIKYKVE